jgi:hypothetical protein
VDLRKIVADADREGVLGFHSSEDGELVVRGGELPPCSAARSASEQREMQRAEEARLQSRGDIPPLVEQSLGFPFVYGPALVEALLAQGGRARLDAAFLRPPASSADEGEIRTAACSSSCCGRSSTNRPPRRRRPPAAAIATPRGGGARRPASASPSR